MGSFVKNIVYDLKFILFSDKKSQNDDEESGVGPSISATTKSTTMSEVSY